MLKYLISIFFIFIFYCSLSAQESIQFNIPDTCPTGQETAIWYMGKNSLNWLKGNPGIDTGFAKTPGEAQTSICDRNGKLLFYTDNNSIYNAQHKVMKNGMLGFNYAGSSSTMNLIIPKPGTDSIYYLIYPDQISNQFDTFEKKLRYAIIDIFKDNGLGEVILKNNVLMDSSSERVEGIRHCNGKDWWIIGQNAINERFKIWSLTSEGIDSINSSIQTSGNVHNIDYHFALRGYLKSSPNGQYLIEVTSGYDFEKKKYLNSCEIHKFDPSNGRIYNGIEININLYDQELYSGEFSQDISKVYLSGFKIWQLDISEYNSIKISKSLQLIAEPKGNLGAMTLGPNGKIYITKFSSSKFLHIIEKPNLPGLACEFNEDGFNLGSDTGLGSPHFGQGLIQPYRAVIQGRNKRCKDSIATFFLKEACSHTTSWYTPNGGNVIHESNDSISLRFDSNGYYKLIAIYPIRCGFKKDTVLIQVEDCICKTSWEANFTDTIICYNSNLKFKFKSNQEIVTINQKYYKSEDSIIFNNLKRDTFLQIHLARFVGCDTNFIYHLKVLPESKSTKEKLLLCYGDSLFFQDKYYNKSDTLISHFPVENGCDSTHTIYLQFSIPPIIRTINYNLCFGDSIEIGNNWYSRDTNLRFSIKGISSCDSSIEVFNLNINPEKKSVNTNFLCAGDSIFYNSYWIKKDTTLNEIINTNGCDSIHQIIFKEYPRIVPHQNYYQICFGDSIKIKNQWQKSSGNYATNYTSLYGCDSLVFDSLFIFDRVISTKELYSICLGDSILINNFWYKDSLRISQVYQNLNSCDSIHEIIISVKQLPEPKQINFTLCFGDSIVIEKVVYYKSTDFNIRKSNSQDKCDSIFQYSIHIEDELRVTLPAIIEVNANEPYVISPTYTDGITKYQWIPVRGLSCSDCPNPEFNYFLGGNYTLIVTDNNGCTASTSFTIQVQTKKDQIYFPNIFSPNGDSFNDTWKPITFNPTIKIISLKVYSNWGALVFSSESNFEWDGKLNGALLNPNVFVYVVKWIDSKNDKHLNRGDFTLVR